MGFKADFSFLQKLTMGAIATRKALEYLRAVGFEAVELERYSTSNKIWSTKVKRLRLPDILCVQTGIRVEARGKANLKIRMSDSPSNPNRKWDAGLRDDDLVALLACQETEAGIVVPGTPVFLSVADLRAAQSTSKLGPPKSASEGAERDRTWPSIVPSADGEVIHVGDDRMVVRMESGRRQSYRLAGKHPYVSPGDTFFAGTSILAGTPQRSVEVSGLLTRSWDPVGDLRSSNAIDRYAAVKAIRHRGSEDEGSRVILEEAIGGETDPRVALELAGAAAFLGSEIGYSRIAGMFNSEMDEETREDLRMEAVLILSEIPANTAASELNRVATDPRFRNTELRQAAVWGLGKTGVKEYRALLPFLDDEDNGVVLHAIVAFGEDAPEAVIRDLVATLLRGGPRAKAAASEALRLVGNATVARELLAAHRTAPNPWIMATLGRLPPSVLDDAVRDPVVHAAIAPVKALSESENWLARSQTTADLQFLTRQIY